ncbi:MAG: AAA family ATPase [Thermodesulfobacteriota bacterium]
MRDEIILTENILEGTDRINALKSQPARSDRMGLFYGLWGRGKSTFVEWTFSNMLVFYVRAMAAWVRSVNMMVEDILKAYRVEAVGNLKRDLRELVTVMKRQGAPLLIDEADRVCRKSLLIEIIRDLHDMARVPVILIGQENLFNVLQRKDMGACFSRMTEVFEFKPLTINDIQQAAKILCGLECGEKVGDFIRTATLGDFRLLNMFLTRAERLCLTNKTPEITLRAAKEAAKILPNPEERARWAASEGAEESRKPFKVVSHNNEREAVAAG